MRITPIPHGLDVSLSNLVRSGGLHMSDIYGDLYRDIEPKRYARGGASNPMSMALGSAWENHLEFLLEKNGVKVFRPGELFTPEGIAYSPDGILEDDERLAEYKFGSMSTKDWPDEPCSSLPPRFNKWLCQIKAYLYHLEMSRARLYFMSVYRPFDPDFRVLDIEFTARELAENWQMLHNHALHKGML